MQGLNNINYYSPRRRPRITKSWSWSWIWLRHHRRSITARVLLTRHALLMLIKRRPLGTRHSWSIIRMPCRVPRSTVIICTKPCYITWPVIHFCGMLVIAHTIPLNDLSKSYSISKWPTTTLCCGAMSCTMLLCMYFYNNNQNQTTWSWGTMHCCTLNKFEVKRDNF